MEAMSVFRADDDNDDDCVEVKDDGLAMVP